LPSWVSWASGQQVVCDGTEFAMPAY
jgi:hypothetical protein